MANETDQKVTVTLEVKHWMLVLMGMQKLLQQAAPILQSMQDRKVDPTTIDPNEALALVGPAVVRAAVVDELVKVGVMTPEAGKEFGMSMLREIEANAPPEVRNAYKKG